MSETKCKNQRKESLQQLVKCNLT